MHRTPSSNGCDHTSEASGKNKFLRDADMLSQPLLDRIFFHTSQNENPTAMAVERHSFFARILLLMGIAFLMVSAQEDIDEALYLFLSSQVSPPPECPEFELYQTCSGNCSDCAHRGDCRADCFVQGCECVPNYARLEPGGPCQPVHLCPVLECGENEVFRECGAVCERCGGLRCRMLQCEHRCYCAQGHLRDDQGRCVPEEHCPPHKVRCFRNEELGSSGREDEFCQRDKGTSNKTETKERCYCKEGHSRDGLGLCVSDEHCERVQCPGVEVWQSCPRKCGVSCRGDSDCHEDGQCFPGCFCPEGFLVDDFRRCVPEQECPPPTAGSSPSSPLSTEPTDSPTTLSEVQVSCSSPTIAKEGFGGEGEVQLPGEGATSTNTTESDGTIPNSESTKETTPSPAATTKPSTVDTSTTAQETTDDEATTPEEDEVDTTTTPSTTTIPAPDEEENDF
ncbi:hypothetical protein JTE90_017422 [Oedothorax gibbosus]|uniref:TIL domain-containing protein n=1 Tax=Oedothorax gibbosus TaxID=931172 RepID=A0AAV6U7F6_9ARAC|nr:hypothetical protein JTE90_017422 [Oedothorax gibbosus]